MRIGTKDFNNLSDERKVKLLVQRDYKEAAFAKKRNAELFARLWQQMGYTVSGFMSTGPTIENPMRRTKSYYVRVHNKRRSGKRGTAR